LPHVAVPLDDVRLLTRAQGGPVIDLARSALAVRGREVHAMSQPNRAEVYLVDLGEGVRLALIGAAPEQRLSLEANYGYLLISNGVPIGYGGVSPLYRQANTGIVFDAPAAAKLSVRHCARVPHAVRVRCFVINGYQFGAGNRKRSCAYWFITGSARPRRGRRRGVKEAFLRRRPAASAALLWRPRVATCVSTGDFDAGDYFRNRCSIVSARQSHADRLIAVRSHRDGERHWFATPCCAGHRLAPVAAAVARAPARACSCAARPGAGARRTFARLMATAEGRRGARLRARLSSRFSTGEGGGPGRTAARPAADRRERQDTRPRPLGFSRHGAE
jgi:hypothetical protein